MYQLKKLFHFEMAHILSKSYSKECQSFHGHSYKLEVMVQSNTLTKHDVVIDFKQLKEIVQPIVDAMDHKCLVESTVTVTKDIKKQMIQNGMLFVDYNPTAENMVKYFYDKIFEILGKKFIIKINLWETETGCVSYWNDKEIFE